MRVVYQLVYESFRNGPGALPPFLISFKTQEYKRADERTRTADLLITSELLYLLSYVGL